ncbi:acyltransferase PapA5 [Segniliparus rotundus DSM 44985]|uniref:Phthiocerol/phthiodiolone dimycocerosyl transferase n=1 Tax=Segniliparus rotundus (strain ATCC BAA-972 / CDC 1076 / CIP 108378 / DSM 44985 / JCM 13578) TaxID=640132 RepID=D6ZF95_SEGRD|nr:acyltransferase PapA5 [Segniliparus rotundus]ADG97619.1 acyltransferase PapA5 [Segniliparus rotundus DSM 44985]
MPDKMTGLRLVRVLSPFETFFALGSMTLRFTAVLRGSLDTAALREAFVALRRANPSLNGRVEPHEQGLALVVDEFSEPVVRVREGDFDERFDIMDHTQHLVELELVSKGDRHWVSLSVSHTMADARLGYTYFLELLSTYTDLVTTGAASDGSARPVPDAPEALLAERGIVKRREPGAMKLAGVVSLATDEKASESSPRMSKQALRFDKRTSKALLDAAKARGISMHGVVAGAAISAARTLMEGHGNKPIDFGLSSQVDIRSRIQPPVGIDAGTNVLGFSYARVAARPEDDPFELGKSVTDQLREDLADGVVQQYVLHLDDMGARLKDPSPTLGISNVGVLVIPRTPDSLTVEGVIGGIESDFSTLNQLRSAAPEEERPAPMPPLIGVYSVLDELHIQLLHSESTFPKARAEQLVRAMETVLRKIALP